MAANIQCPPGTRKVGMECIPLGGEPAGQRDIQYYKQYLQDLPQYQTPGQGAYTGPGTDAFHPLYGRTRSNRVLATPFVEGAPGYAGGRSGYDPGDVGFGYRVQETPKITNAPFSYGGPTGISSPMVNVGDLLGGAPGGGGTPPAGIPAGSVSGGGGLFNLGGLFGGGAPSRGIGGGAPFVGGAPLVGDIGGGAPSRRSTPGRGGKGAGRAKKSGGAAKGSSSGLAGSIPKGAGAAP